MYSNLNINIQNFSRGLRQASAQVNSFAANTRDKINSASRGFDTASDRVRRFGSNLNGHTSNAIQAMEELRKSTNGYGFTLQSISRIVSGIIISQVFYNIVQQVRDATRAVWEFTKQLEYAQIAYSNLFGDVALAQEFINVLKDFAAKTPFTFTEAESAAKRLLAYGIEYENIMYVMQGVLAAASMQGDATKIESISRALGQIYTYGKLMTAEVRQLSEAGIPAYEILQEELGLTQEQLRNLGNEAIPASVAINALVDGMQKRFGNVVNASALTIQGIISNIKDNATMLASGLFEPMTVVIKSALAEIGNFLFTLRDIEETAGAGGVFEALFPPELHDTLRLFAANVKAAVQSVLMLGRTIAQFLQPVLMALIAMYNVLSPIITAFIRVLTGVLYVIANNAAAMKVLTVMLAAAAAMWTVFQIRAVAAMVVTVVIKAIINALGALSAMLTFVAAHPFWALLIALGGVVVGLSVGFGNLGNKVKNFFKQLTSFNGVDADSILLPSQEDRANDLEKFNNALDTSADAMDELADSTDKAGKAAKKTMQGLLSFDEVFKLNEPDETSSGSGGIDTSGIDDLTDALGGLDSIGSGYMPDVPDFNDYMDSLVDGFLTPFKSAWDLIKENIVPIASSAIGTGLGAAIGLVLGGPIGAKIGAVIGGLIGGLWGMIAEELGVAPTQHLATLFSGALMAFLKSVPGLISGMMKNLVVTYVDDVFAGFSRMAGYSLAGSLVNAVKGGIAGMVVGLGVGILANALTGWIAKELDLTAKDMENAGIGQFVGNIVGSIVGLLLGGPIGAMIGGAIGQLAGSIVGLFWDSMSNAMKGFVLTGGIGVIVGLIMDYWEPIKTFFKTAGDGFVAFFKTVGKGFTTVFKPIKEFFKNTYEALNEGYEEITGFFGDVFGVISEVLGNIFGVIGTVLGDIFEAVSTVWSDIFEAIDTVLSDIFEAVSTVWHDIFNAIGTVLSDIFSAVSTVWQDILGAISTVLEDIWGVVSSVFELIRDIIERVLEIVLGVVVTIWTTILTTIKAKLDAIWTVVSTIFLAIKEAIKEKLDAVWTVISTVFNTIKTFITNIVTFIWQKIDEKFGHIFDAIQAAIYAAYIYVTTWFTNIYNNIKDKVYAVYSYVYNWFYSVYTSIRDNVTNAYNAVVDFFKDMYNGVKDRITDMYESVKTGTKDIYKIFTDWVSDLYNSTFGKLFDWLDTGIEKIREFLKLDEKAGKTTSSNSYSTNYGSSSGYGAFRAGHATGGIFDREHIARFAEGNKAEAVIPLENASAMQPFVDAISRGIIEGLAPTLIQTGGSSNGASDLPPMYVGTLVADDRGLKQLYRKFELIKVQEDARKGLAY